MVIRTVDGLAYPFNVERVDSVYFEPIQQDDSNDEDETTVTGSATDITTYTATISSWANILDNLSTDLKVGIIYQEVDVKVQHVHKRQCFFCFQIESIA